MLVAAGFEELVDFFLAPARQTKIEVTAKARGCYGLVSPNGFKGLDGDCPQALSV